MLDSDCDQDSEPRGLVGKAIGPFRLNKFLGQGGMATVFQAEREGADFEQTVAIKLLRRGLFSSAEQKLFRRERQLLAKLNHPNIARLIDGGVTEAGIPYLVLEYIDGLGLDQYVIRRGLGLRERLDLFVKTCRAVEFAHQALIVHCDIKPSNILVTYDGIPKLLDFGIAKLLLDEQGSDLLHHSFAPALTPGYAAPEQITGAPVTTSVDIYALGVVLHELLTGLRPREMGSVPASAAISEIAADTALGLPLPLPQLRRELKGDLDKIVSRALSIDPIQRYPSVGALILDLESYLSGNPVRARPPTMWYVVGKFVKRHRRAAVILLALSISILCSLAVAILQGRAARAEAQRANIVKNFLLDLLDTAKAELQPDEQPTPKALASKAAERLASNNALPELTRADLLYTLGKISLTAGAYEQAAQLLEECTAIREAVLGNQHDDTLAAWVELARIRKDQGRFADARQLLQRALPTLRRRDSKILIPALSLMGMVELFAGNPDLAVAFERESSQVASRLLDPKSLDAKLSKFGLGNLLITADRWQEGIDALEPALADWRASGLSTDHAQYSMSVSNLAVAYHAVGDYDKAIPLFEQSLAARRKALPPNHASLGNSLASLGMLLAGKLRFTEAESHLQEALRIARNAYGNVHMEVVLHLAQLANIEIRRNQSASAARYAREAVDICENAKWPPSSDCSYATVMLGAALRDSDSLESLRLLDGAVAQYKMQHKAPHPLIATSMSKRAASLMTLGRLDDALLEIDAAIHMFEAARAGETPDALAAFETRALVLHSLGRSRDALATLDHILPTWRKRFASRKDRMLSMLETRAKVLFALGERSAAAAAAREALALGVGNEVLLPESLRFLESVANID